MASDRVNKQTVAFLLAVALVSVLGGAVAWRHADQLRHASRAQIIAMTLEPIEALLDENKAIIKELQTEPFTEKDAAILESYLAKIRRDGVPKHADMKQRLDQLAENNTAIVTLINVYSLHAKTPAFKSEADKFRILIPPEIYPEHWM